MAKSKIAPLSVSSVSKDFKEKKVLKNVSLSVRPGEIYGLIGVNGVGKTTLIKIILDLLNSDKGETKFFDQDTTDPDSRKNIAYLPEKFYPSPFLKGREFLSLSLSYHGKKLDIKEAKAKAKVLDLDPKVLDHRIGKYSKGMGQKLGLLSMFLAGSPLLLLDEPMSGLDPNARIKLKALLKEYKEQGNTVFFSSHILADIEEICDRMAVMHNGKLIYEGDSATFLKKYKEKNLEMAFLRAIESDK
ncbi:MAG: ABC transporter ATP-binding protein [Rickettsiales bacterium]|nr:ABC transporter ATP-binding protein [Pseudomonadota bacterium]MDA0967186.1 ABC transporter ATP-binding protein [Pseudomonadota bacterium]MDG4544154.1 ABC transporter ATP-binding protein [Rickettsiales bacterium]MDG4546335.1 ABC transporter ATP-binding protein [Rickettsiales bacterium]MDG4548478.1 ABC transporter ATP-binding protein [Rickettsiales bacterium]